MKTILRLLILSALLITSLGYSAIPASANTKEVNHYEFSAASEVQVCDNGQILVEEFTCIWDATVWSTDSGEFFRFEEDVIMLGKVYLKDEPDKFLNYEHLQWKNFTKPSGVMQSAGILMKMNVPGYGNIWQDIGHFVFAIDPVKGYLVPVRLDGKHEFMMQDGYPYKFNYDAPCDYLTSLP